MGASVEGGGVLVSGLDGGGDVATDGAPVASVSGFGLSGFGSFFESF